MTHDQPKLCLVTGATGYIGGRLVPELLEAGYRVRAMTRDAGTLRDAPWACDVEIVDANAGSPEDVRRALDGVDVAYYLIHALATGAEFEITDRQTARTFARAARAVQTPRIVYLGGLIPDDEEPSPHLRSRAEVGDILLDSTRPTAVLRAAVIIGSGSASFEMLRYLTERLPAMITPRWVSSRIQPIAIRDVLRYLVGCAELPPDVSRTFDIGGPEVLTYEDMMQRYARVAGLRPRLIVPVPVLTPRLSSHWVGVVTPVPNSIARPLVESLKNTVVCQEHDIAAYVPDPPEGLIGFDAAVELALTHLREFRVPTHWSSAARPDAPSDPLPSDPDWAGGSVYKDERERVVNASSDALWRVISGIGGEQGWYSFPLAWRIRGWMDRFSGGPGLRRGRRDPNSLFVGEAVDWWRVEEITPPALLRLRAEMRLPGHAWLELIVDSDADGRTVFRQRALFEPKGLAGHLYWASVWPFHGIVFGEMQRNIAVAAERLERESGAPASASDDDVRRAVTTP